ncbi:hypothetical protein TNCV_5034211 [Trichonephila clavipes]|nr:hypothetical protein TNCV_5034211 [Trichonephila clavipes]
MKTPNGICNGTWTPEVVTMITKLPQARPIIQLNSYTTVTGSRVFSLTCPLGSLGPELMATLFQPKPKSTKSVSEPDEIGIVIEVADLARQINLEVDSDDVQEFLDSNNQELATDELTKKHEQEQDVEENLSLITQFNQKIE